jgi:monofunctional biosynthetic peptidoglycan transglycosylase
MTESPEDPRGSGDAPAPPPLVAEPEPPAAESEPDLESGPEERPPLGGGEPPARPGRRRLRGCLRVLWIVLALVGAWLLWKLVTWPDVAALAHEHPKTSAFIERWERRHDREASHRWVPYGSISPHLKRAVLVGEDINFFSHDGFERTELEKALHDAWEEKRVPRGASTVTQQLAKNLWLSPSRNPLRKLEEAILTVQLERHLEKRRILELYLNVVELGPGIYGAEAASRHYFGKPASALSEREAASLAASLPNPDGWHPGSRSRAYRNRANTLLRRMGKAGFLWKEI